jgi:hypothetical protein
MDKDIGSFSPSPTARVLSGSLCSNRDTTECRRFENDGSPKDRLAKPFDSVKKPWKKLGGGESNQMAYLTERLLKLEKKQHGTVRNVLVTHQIVIPTVSRIVGLVAREV